MGYRLLMSVGPDERLHRSRGFYSGHRPGSETDMPGHDLGLVPAQTQAATPEDPRRLAVLGQIPDQATEKGEPATGVNAVCGGQDAGRCQVGDDLGGEDALGQDQLTRLGADG